MSTNRPRSKSVTLDDRPKRPEQRDFHPIPLPDRQHNFQLQVQFTEKNSNVPISDQRARSNSFDMHLSASQDNAAVGKLHMTVHRNLQPFVVQNPGEAGKRMQGQSTAYIGRIDNLTFDPFNPQKQVKGVGSTLMNQAEHLAQAYGARKITLDPAPSQHTRTVMDEVPDESTFGKLLKRTKLVPRQETVKFDPTDFYRAQGYKKDRAQHQAYYNEISPFVPDHETRENYAQKNTSLMSKPLFTRGRAKSV